MKDRFEAKLILFIIPALAIWEVLYQLVIIRLIPAAKNDTVHGVGVGHGMEDAVAGFWICCFSSSCLADIPQKSRNRV